MTPILELIPPAFRGDSPRREVVRRIAGEIDKAWGASPAFVDVQHLCKAGIREAGGTHILRALAEEVRQVYPLLRARSNLVPVTGLHPSAGLREALASIIEEDKTGVCLRITPRDVARRHIADEVESLLSQLRLDIPDADLVIDYQASTKPRPDFNSLCLSLPQLPKWRSFVVLMGAFPKDLQGFEKNSKSVCPRVEWVNWHSQVLTLPRGLRRPTFGDYTIQYPKYEEPPENCNPSASIRYTHAEEWVIMRGEGIKNTNGAGSAQYPAEAKVLCEMDEFCGERFSRGDRYIRETTRRPGEPGNPCTWLRAGVNHHITFVTRQISAVFGAPAEAFASAGTTS